MTIGLYSHGMHDFVLRECEVGRRVAAAEDDEYLGLGPLLDASYAEYCRAHPDEPGRVEGWRSA